MPSARRIAFRNSREVPEYKIVQRTCCLLSVDLIFCRQTLIEFHLYAFEGKMVDHLAPLIDRPFRQDYRNLWSMLLGVECRMGSLAMVQAIAERS